MSVASDGHSPSRDTHPQQWRIQETGKGVPKYRAQRAEFGVTPTSGAVKLGKIPFSARGSPILDCVELLLTVN